jgi:hypothetical protein
MMMETNIAVIFCSKKSTEENKDFIEHIKTTCGCETHLYCIHNPDGVSISKIYADMMESPDINENILVYIHDDIEFLRPGWGAEVLRLFNDHKDYSIIGIAGSAQFDENGAWWNYDKKYGQVLHRSDGKSWLTAFSPLLDKDLEDVVVIDGLFMAIDKTKIKENFNRDLNGFDMYDIWFCMKNYFAGCKIGVTTNIRVAHNSIGKLKESWYQNREIINNEFGKYYPIDITTQKPRRRWGRK